MTEKKYPGAKNAPGVYQAIINEMPPHEVYVEAFAGSGAILKRKQPAASTIAIDRDAAALVQLQLSVPRGFPNLKTICGDARSLLAGYSDAAAARGVLVYCDPPYIMETRRSQRAIYKHEFNDDDHKHLVAVLLTLKCKVMVSGYFHWIYTESLERAGWRRVDYRTATHRGTVTESLWCNFPKVARPHDLRYLGGNFRERERMKRQRARWRARLEKMPEAERAAILAELLDLASPKAAMLANSRAGIAENGERIPRAGSIAGNDDAAGGGDLAASHYSTMLEAEL